jgi:hypothetical protein
MEKTDFKFRDPEALIKSVVDDYGEPMFKSEQEDVQIFFTNLISRVQDGIGENDSLLVEKV